MVVKVFNPSTWRQRQVYLDLCELEPSLVYKMSSWTAVAIQKNPALKNNNINTFNYIVSLRLA